VDVLGFPILKLGYLNWEFSWEYSKVLWWWGQIVLILHWSVSSMTKFTYIEHFVCLEYEKQND
jgi:hypothetical protein